MSDLVPNPTIKFAVPQPLYDRALAEVERVGITLQQLMLMALVDRLDVRSEGERPSEEDSPRGP